MVYLNFKYIEGINFTTIPHYVRWWLCGEYATSDNMNRHVIISMVSNYRWIYGMAKIFYPTIYVDVITYECYVA